MTQEKNNKIINQFIDRYGYKLHNSICDISKQDVCDTEKLDALCALNNNIKPDIIRTYFGVLQKKKKKKKEKEKEKETKNKNNYQENYSKEPKNNTESNRKHLLEFYFKEIDRNFTTENSHIEDIEIDINAKNSLKQYLYKRIEAAIKIQSRWRIVISKRKEASMILMSKRFEASMKIQSRWRILMSKRFEASMKIQSRWRIVLSKRILIKIYIDSISKINAFSFSDFLEEFREEAIALALFN